MNGQPPENFDDDSPPDSHPDDDRLSAWLDGVERPDVGGHLAGCRSCQNRFDELTAVAAAVASAVVAPSSAGVDRAVATARQAWVADRGGKAAPAGPAGPPGTLPPPSPIPIESARGRRVRQGWGRAIGIAAAAAAVLGAVSLATSLGGRSSPDGGGFAAPPTRESAEPADSLMAEAAPGPAPAAADRATAGAPGATSGLGPGATLADLGERAELAELVDLARKELTLTPSSDATDESVTRAEAAPCATEAARAAGSVAERAAYVATLRFGGSPAVLHAFDDPAPDGGNRGQLIVMATPGCRLLGAADL